MCILPNRPLYRDQSAAYQPDDGEPFSTTTILHTCTGVPRLVRRLDPVHDCLEHRRARFLAVESDGMIRLADNDGNELPDLRHPQQIYAY